MFWKKPKKKTDTVLFKKTVCNVPWNIRTQEIDCEVHYWGEIEDCIQDMFRDADEFVTLSTGELCGSIRFVQACQERNGTGIIVELGLEENDHTKLVERVCQSEEECLAIFEEFYQTGNVKDWKDYSPVEF